MSVEMLAPRTQIQMQVTTVYSSPELNSLQLPLIL